MKYNCCHRNGELLSLPLQQKGAASLKGTCSKQGSPRSTAARQCDSIGRRKTIRLSHCLFINTDPVRVFQDINRKKTEKCSHIRVDSPI